MIITNLSDIERYNSISTAMASACKFLGNLDIKKMNVGDFEISDEVHGSCIEYVADGVVGEQFENHHDWIDIHLVISNCEKMAITSQTEVITTKKYNEANDIAFFKGDAEQIVNLFPGNALIVFPEDLHQPKVRVNDDIVRKVCIKVKI